MFESVLESIANNSIFTAGLGLVGVGTGLAVLKQGGKQLDYLARRHFLTTIDIPSYDKSYFWVLQWINKQIAQRSQHISVKTSFVQRDNGSFSTQFSFVPSPGRHYFKWKGIWFQVERQRERPTVDISSGSSSAMETLTMTAVTRDRSIVSLILDEAREEAFAGQEGKTVIYTSWGQEWKPFGYPRRRRPLSSVILDKGISDRILSDVNDFLANGKWYVDRGIPYRRGYLLYGPPGSGKSSFIQALAGELEYNICVLNLSEKYLSDDRLNLLMSVIPQRSIVILEDIDAAFTNQRESTGKTEGNNMTFSGFLNALDGVVSSEGRIIFMTTNHIERLDKALLRPGRVDLKVLIGNASDYQINEMFLRFYEGETDLADKFVKKLKGYEVSAAQLQGHFVHYKNDPLAALSNAHYLTQDGNELKIHSG
ncbi:hypothetical protein MP638_002196 [Amoeboaphelidium occidentale]|nr:hypothetical protein MP638_002196 [Amoeboaphelidium occidentale]